MIINHALLIIISNDNKLFLPKIQSVLLVLKVLNSNRESSTYNLMAFSSMQACS